MRKFLIALVACNILIASIFYLPKFFKGRQKPSDLPFSTAGRSGPPKSSGFKDFEVVADIQQTAFKKNLPQQNFYTLVHIIDTNRSTNDLSQHLARGDAMEVIAIAAASQHLPEDQKPRALQSAVKDLEFVKTLSDNSAALSSIPVEARRSGFNKEVLDCLVVVYFSASEQEAVPIALPYADSPDDKTRELVKKILQKAHYQTK